MIHLYFLQNYDDIEKKKFLDLTNIDNENAELKVKGLRITKYDRQLVGITVAALKTESFLSASSFEQQVRVLSDAAIFGKVDNPFGSIKIRKSLRQINRFMLYRQLSHGGKDRFFKFSHSMI